MKKFLFVACFVAGPVLAAEPCPGTRPDDFNATEDGLVIDNGTGLMWTRCLEGMSWDGTSCTGTATEAEPEDAFQLAVDATHAGYNDWRVPNIKELDSLAEWACHAPALDAAAFPGMPADGFLWSSTPYFHGEHAGFWMLGIEYGQITVDTRDNRAHVLLVRNAD